MESTQIPVPVLDSRFRPLISRLENLQHPSLSRQDIISIIFVVRLGDILHRSFYGSFLTTSLVESLCDHLNISDLSCDVQVFGIQWSYRQGEVVVKHCITFDYDMYTVYVLTKIARAVLQNSISPREGLHLIKAHETKHNYNCIEARYRSFPSRVMVIPLLAASCATVFFDGTWYDFGFAGLCGIVAGLLTWITSLHDQLLGVADYVVAIAVAMISVGSIVLFPHDTCFIAQVLGTLYWYFYGTAFVISLYEITNSQLLIGVSRFAQATLRSYGLAFGAMIGVWFLSLGPSTDLDIILSECTTKGSQISDLWFVLLFPLAGIACLMQFRVSMQDFPICLTVQVIAYGSQYVLGTLWDQPDFISNMIPALLATLASSLAIRILRTLKLSNLESHQSVRYKKVKKMDLPLLLTNGSNDDDIDTENVECSNTSSTESQADEDVAQDVEVQLTSSTTSSLTRQQPSATKSIRQSDVDDPLPQLPEMSREPRMRRTNPAESEAGGAENDRQQRNSDVIDLGDTTAGYMSNDELTFARTDLWFCLLPALYLLVPGSKIFQAAFSVILKSIIKEPGPMADIDSLVGSLIVVGLSQVIGLRFGFVILWLNHEAGKWIQSKCKCLQSTKVDKVRTFDIARIATDFAPNQTG